MGIREAVYKALPAVAIRAFKAIRGAAFESKVQQKHSKSIAKACQKELLSGALQITPRHM